MMQFNSILITGANGWLGMQLIRALLNPTPDTQADLISPKEIQIHALLLPSQSPQKDLISPNITYHYGNICNANDCDKFIKSGASKNTLLIHTAGIIHPKQVKEFYNINTKGTINLLNSANKYSILKFIYLSSNSPCGVNPTSSHKFNETSAYSPYMHYGKSKKHAEDAVNLFFKESKLNTTILRPPWFYGTHQPARQTLFFKMIQSGSFPVLGNGLQKRSMVYLDNLIQGIIKASISEQSIGQTYWISDETPYSMNTIIRTVKECLEELHFSVSKKQLRLPNFLGTLAQGCDFLLQSCNIYHQKIHVLSEMNKTIACDISKAKHELGYNPTISIKEGMKRSIQWCLDSKLLETNN